MKEIRFRLILIIGAIALSLYLLYPTYQDYLNNKEVGKTLESLSQSIKQSNPEISAIELKEFIQAKKDSILSSNPDYKSARDKRVKLGLDLQGGMYLVMEVNTAKLLERLAKDPDEQFKQLLSDAEQESKLTEDNVVTILSQKMQEKGIRLSRYFGTIREDDADIQNRLLEQESDAVSRALEIINNRINQYGVSEPSIQKQGSRRIIVELPGISREEEAKRLLQGRALLEFKLLKDPDFAIPIMNRIDEVLAAKDSSSKTIERDTTKDLTEAEFTKQHPFFGIARLIDPQGRMADAFVKESDRDVLNNLLSRPEVKKVIPDNVEFIYEAKPEMADGGIQYYRLYMVNKQAELTGGVIVDAQANLDPTTSAPVVSMQMNSEGSREWARITGSNIGKRCAIVLDGVAYSAPTIQGKIPSGNSQISGIPNLDEAKLLEIVLKAGALPAPIDIIEERTVGPSLGQDSISQGFNSMWLGYLMVAVFMIVYYKKAGSMANIGIIVTMLIILGVLAGFQGTLTLPGIAGIVLTMGMAVDANVLIYERIREELATGKTVKASVESGFKQSFSAIFDSNITTFFTGIILYQFGSGPVQGFALTLMIGIAASLFSALVLVRVMFDFMIVKGLKIQVG
ncbi:MAG: protein translocase subunit SecD [Melioribacteraceae bacterium]|nr:protein translocase subunit SecD [Melioribacteraceae bacterium]